MNREALIITLTNAKAPNAHAHPRTGKGSSNAKISYSRFHLRSNVVNAVP